MRKELEMRMEAIADIKETLENGYSGYYCDLHNEVFNTDYYIIGYAKAEKCLEEYGVFKAIRKVKEYEEFNFGEVYTDLADSEKLVNMLYYIIGEEVMAEIEWNDCWNELASEEVNEIIIAELEDL